LKAKSHFQRLSASPPIPALLALWHRKQNSDSEKTMARSCLWSRRIGALALGACLLGAAPAQAQFFPFGGETTQPRPAATPPALSPGQVRGVLAREGARMLGQPRLRGRDIIAIGRDEEGARKRFILDAATGEIIDITVLDRRDERPPSPPGADLSPPGAALPPPVHAPDNGLSDPAPPRDTAAPSSLPPRPAPSAPAAGKAAAGSSPPPDAPPAPAASRNPADGALSPIRPLKPAGAPKVEPLPQ
jgi:hypothetical protein